MNFENAVCLLATEMDLSSSTYTFVIEAPYGVTMVLSGSPRNPRQLVGASQFTGSRGKRQRRIGHMKLGTEVQDRSRAGYKTLRGTICSLKTLSPHLGQGIWNHKKPLPVETEGRCIVPGPDRRSSIPDHRYQGSRGTAKRREVKSDPTTMLNSKALQ